MLTNSSWGYVKDGFVLRSADERLEPVAGPVFVEVYDDADSLSRTLDGAEAAFVQLALALGHFFTYPLDSIASLKNLPAGVAALLESSPEYFERFRYMTRGDDEAWWVGGVGRNSGGVKFDGFKDGVLLEAKGLGYAAFFEDSLAPEYWYKKSGKAEDLIDQARRQRAIVRGMDIRIEWHVAEEHAANTIRKLLEGRGFTEIIVIHTPARPGHPETREHHDCSNRAQNLP